MYEKIRKLLYIILVLITLYMTFMGIRQFIYLKGGVEFKSYRYETTYEEYEKFKKNVQIIKENGYLVYEDSVSDYSFDYSENMEYLIKRIDYTKLLSNERIVVKNTELLNIYGLIHNIHNMDIYCLTRLKMIDKENFKYYDLASTTQYINFYSYYVVDENGNYVVDDMYNENGIQFYYSDYLYNYSEVNDNTKLLDEYYKELGMRLTKLNKTLNFIIEVGETNESN